jgi:hypothetical protein
MTDAPGMADPDLVIVCMAFTFLPPGGSGLWHRNVFRTMKYQGFSSFVPDSPPGLA